MEATSRPRKKELWHTQQTGSDGKRSEIYQDEWCSRKEAAVPPVVNVETIRVIHYYIIFNSPESISWYY